MTATEIAALLSEQFPGALTTQNLDALDPFVVVDGARLLDVALFLRDDPRLRFEILNDITGVDYLETDAKKIAKAGFEPHLEIVYHLSSFHYSGRRFTIKIVLPRWKGDVPGQLPEVFSLAKVWPTANWQEREVFDLLGVQFLGHPDLRRILLADDWAGYPLRKDYEYPVEYHGIRCR